MNFFDDYTKYVNKKASYNQCKLLKEVFYKTNYHKATSTTRFRRTDTLRRWVVCTSK